MTSSPFIRPMHIEVETKESAAGKKESTTNNKSRSPTTSKKSIGSPLYDGRS